MPLLPSIIGALFDPVQATAGCSSPCLCAPRCSPRRKPPSASLSARRSASCSALVVAQFRVLQRGLMPYVVASQTIPILAIAPMVVVGLGSLDSRVDADDWLRVSVIAAYLTFFPVTVNTVRGLDSADPRAVELMRTYAASEWAVFWKLRLPSSLPYLFAAFRVAATACVVGAIVGELPSSIQGGLGGAIINFNQYYVLDPQNLWATNLVAAASGSGSSSSSWAPRSSSSTVRRSSSYERGETPSSRFAGVTKTFPKGGVTALEGIDLDVGPGEFVSLIGPSGCGKSTLLRVIGDLAPPTDGRRSRQRQARRAGTARS